jgi:hypothetical protein
MCNVAKLSKIKLRTWTDTLVRPKQRKRDMIFGMWNVKMDLQEMGCGGMDWIELAQVSDRWRTLVTGNENQPAINISVVSTIKFRLY